MFPFTVLAARNLKMRCQQCWFLGVLRENPEPVSQLLVLPAVLGIFWLVDTSLMLQCVLTWQCPLFRACPNPVWPALNFITFAMTLFPNKVTFRGTRA